MCVCLRACKRTCMGVCVYVVYVCVCACVGATVCAVADYGLLLATIEESGVGTTNEELVEDPQHSRSLAEKLDVSLAEAVLWQWRRDQKKKGLKEDEQQYYQLSSLLEEHLVTFFAGEMRFKPEYLLSRWWVF